MAAIELRAVSFTYPGQTAPALDGIDLTVESGAFFVLCGPSGSGKSTLLRQLVPDLAPHGMRSGEILFDGAPLAALDRRTRCQRIGFVGQSPEDQLVTDKVWHELAFGLESLGLDDAVIRRRVAEMAAFFGIEGWFRRDVADLSGGQKQLLVLAAALVTGPDVLILDEPTAQLDPIAAGEFLATLARIGRELGTTIVMTEHRLEDALPLATDAAVLDGGRLLCAGAPAAVGAALRARGHAMSLAMPTAMRVWAAADGTGPCPVTVAQGRRWLAGPCAPCRRSRCGAIRPTRRSRRRGCGSATTGTGPTWYAGWTSRCGVESCWRSWAATGPGNRPPSRCWRACWPPSAAP